MTHFAGIPKVIGQAILLIKSLDFNKAQKLCQSIMYLWREFYIKIKIRPVITTFKISFYYKDTQLIRTEVNKLEDAIEIIERIKQNRISK